MGVHDDSGGTRDGGSLLGAWLGSSLEAIDRISFVAVAAGMAVMVTVVAAQVFMRYVLNESLASASEVARLSFVWVVFLALPHGIPRARHVAMDVVVALLPEAFQDALLRLVAIGAALLMVLVSVEAWAAAMSSWDQLMPTLSFSYGWFYIALAVSGVHAALHFLRLVVLGRHGQQTSAIDDPEETAA